METYISEAFDLLLLLLSHFSRVRLCAQGNRLSCRDQEGRRGSEEALPRPSVFPSREPIVSGDFWGRTPHL